MLARGLERRDTSSERNLTNGIFKGRGRRRIPGAIAPDRLNGKDLPPHCPDACGLRTRIPDRTALRAMMARSALCPVHFLFFVLRAGGHNGVQLGILREAVNKWDGGIPEEQQPFAGIGMGHIGKLVGADPKLFG